MVIKEWQLLEPSLFLGLPWLLCLPQPFKPAASELLTGIELESMSAHMHYGDSDVFSLTTMLSSFYKVRCLYMCICDPMLLEE